MPPRSLSRCEMSPARIFIYQQVILDAVRRILHLQNNIYKYKIGEGGKNSQKPA